MINYVKGDATLPIGEGEKAIVHICNDIGAWGSGFVVALSDKWPETRKAYISLDNYYLGDVQRVKVESNITVINMIAQRGTISKSNPAPIRYIALAECLGKAFLNTPGLEAVHMPRIGCGLAGGVWARVEEIVVSAMALRPSVKVYVYDL